MITARIYDYLCERSVPVHHTELADKFLHIKHIDGKVSERLIGSILTADSKFKCDDRGFWKVSEGPVGYGVRTRISEATYTVVDVETTGGEPPLHKVTEIAAVRVENSEIKEMFTSLVNPGRYIPYNVSRITGIYDEMVTLKPKLSSIIPRFLNFLGDSVFVAQNVSYDMRFINFEINDLNGGRISNPALCTARLARRLLPNLKKRSVDALARYFGFDVVARHRAYGDAAATARIFCEFLKILPERGIETLDELIDFQKPRMNKSSSKSRTYQPIYAEG